MGKGKTLKKVGKIALNVLLYLFLALGIFSIVISISSKKDSDGAASIFGYQLRFVQSESMAECEGVDVSKYDIGSIPVKSLVFIDEMPEDEAEAQEWYKGVQVGDVLTFKYEIVTGRAETITHRVVKKEDNGKGGYLIYLAGDNRASDSNGDGIVDGGDNVPLEQVIDTSRIGAPDYYNYIIGRVTGKSHFLGLLVYALKIPVGIVCIIIVPCLFIIGMEIIKIIKVMNSDKKEREKKEKDKTLSELEELKKQLALLQQAQQNNSDKEE